MYFQIKVSFSCESFIFFLINFQFHLNYIFQKNYKIFDHTFNLINLNSFLYTNTLSHVYGITIIFPTFYYVLEFQVNHLNL